MPDGSRLSMVSKHKNPPGNGAERQKICRYAFTEKRKKVGDLVNQQYKKTVPIPVPTKK